MREEIGQLKVEKRVRRKDKKAETQEGKEKTDLRLANQKT